MNYLKWSKVHPKVRFELSYSGVPSFQLEDYGASQSDVELEVRGTYGDPALIEFLAARYTHGPEGIVPVPGASGGNFIALAIAAKRGSSVLLEQPVYEPLKRVVKFLGMEVIPLQRVAATEFEVSPEAVPIGLAQGACCVILTNLHNPSGQWISRERMHGIAVQCARAGATLVVDEVYLDAAHLTHGSPLWTAAEFGDHVVAINSLTKVYGLSGLRAGWLLTGSALAEQAREMLDLLCVNNAAPAASLARPAFRNMERIENAYRRGYAEGQRVFRRWLAEEPRVRGYESHGAIFEFVRLPAGVRAHYLAEVLARDFETQVVPGDFFEVPDHIRIGLCLSPLDLAEGLRRISLALDRVCNQDPGSTSANGTQHRSPACEDSVSSPLSGP